MGDEKTPAGKAAEQGAFAALFEAEQRIEEFLTKAEWDRVKPAILAELERRKAVVV